MKETVKITVIAAGFKDANKKNLHQKPTFLPKTWKAEPERVSEPTAVQHVEYVNQVQMRQVDEEEEVVAIAPPPPVAPPAPAPTVVQQVQQNLREVRNELREQMAIDDLDVPTFLRRQAQKARN